MTRFEVTIEIAQPRDDVFAYVADPQRFSAWNSAVQSVVPLGDAIPAEGARYLMRRALPSGPAQNELEVVALRPPTEFALRTTSGPTPFVYRYEFTTTGAGTRVTLHAELTVGGGAALLGPLAAHGVRRGVEANFATLRGILERGESS